MSYISSDWYFRIGSGKRITQVIVDNQQMSDDDDDNFVVEESIPAPEPQKVCMISLKKIDKVHEFISYSVLLSGLPAFSCLR